MDGPFMTTHLKTQSRQKRVLPSRSRRGGPGVGSCDADVMILETQRRKFENEPLIPAGTRFLLTTNSAVASTSSTTLESGINILANERYFDRPEVLKAYREQKIIETPEFISLGDIQSTGRLRARSQAGTSEDGPPETSDAAYEKRHRKYETFEKRQRLREKEKLKHEQYKLKERIEQLRAMDSGAFLTLPASLFPPPLKQTDDVVEGDSVELTGTHVNGAAAHEGERRRKEMLEIASLLEDRYRVLLPPDRMKKPPGQIIIDTPVEAGTAYAWKDRYDAEPSEEPFIETTYKEVTQKEVTHKETTHKETAHTETTHKETEKLKLKIKFPGRHPNVSLPVSASASNSASSRRGRHSSKQPHITRKTRDTHETAFVQSDPPLSQVLDPPLASSDLVLLSPPHVPLHEKEPTPRPGTPMSNPEIAVLEAGHPDIAVVGEVLPISASVEPLELIPLARPHKRVKISPVPLPPSPCHVTREASLPPIVSISAPMRYRSSSHTSTVQSSRQHVTYAGIAGRPEPTRCHLLISAIRSENSARKAKRHLTAFGVKLRNEVFEEGREFEIPSWADGRPKQGEWEALEHNTEVDTITGARRIMSAAEFFKKAATPQSPIGNGP